MDVRLLRKVLGFRRELGRRQSWSAQEIEAQQSRSLRALREHAYARSPLYRRFHQGLATAPLSELPVLTKAAVMEHFDELVTDRQVRLVDVESHLQSMRGAERFHGRYYVAATAGTTGRQGVFLWDLVEWANILASYNRPYEWCGAAFRLTRRTRMAMVSSTTPWHQSALVGATVDSPFIRTLRVDSGEPLPDIVRHLDGFGPRVLVGYASMLRLLAEEELRGRLHIAPRQIFIASEVLTDQTRRLVAEVWGHQPCNVYAATETAAMAAECEHNAGMHLFEDLVITEVVDERNQAVPPGEFGVKVLVTVLFSRTLPLIRYEISDSVRLAPPGPCLCGKPFARLDGIQGREEETLRFPTVTGGEVAVQPSVFHRIMDTVPAGGWQILQELDRLTVLLAGLPQGFDDSRILNGLRSELGRLHVALPAIRVHHVPAIPRTALGKAPLIRSAVKHGVGRLGPSPPGEK